MKVERNNNIFVMCRSLLPLCNLISSQWPTETVDVRERKERKRNCFYDIPSAKINNLRLFYVYYFANAFHVEMNLMEEVHKALRGLMIKTNQLIR